MHTESKKEPAEKQVTKTALAIKAARITQGLSRKDAAALCGWNRRSFEQLENGRCNITEARLRLLTAKIGLSWEDFLNIQTNPQKHIAQAVEDAPLEKTLRRKPRRNEYKIITKEARVLRALRKQKGLSQSEAAKLCRFGPQVITFLEAGRVELTEKKIRHILSAFGCTWKEFQALLAAPILRNELIEEIVTVFLPRLTDQSLTTIKNVIELLANK